MRNTVKRKILSLVLASALSVSCFSSLCFASAEDVERKSICFEGFEDMEGYVFSPEKTYETTGNYSNPTVTIDKTISHSGESSLKYVSRASTVTKKMIKLRTKPGQAQIVNGSRYHISFYYRVNTTPGSWNLCYTLCSTNDWGMNQANFGNQTELEGNTKDIGTASPNVWTRADVVFTSTKATSTYKYLIFYIQAKGKDFEVNFDDISVTEISADDNVVILNGPTGEKAVYGKSGEDYSSYIEKTNNNDYLSGVYTDKSYSTKVSSTVLGDTTTPVTKNIPTYVYLNYTAREENKFDFDNYVDGYKPDVSTIADGAETGMQCELVNDKEHSSSGNNSLKFSSTNKTGNAKGNIRLDRTKKEDTSFTNGDTYLVTFKYFVDSEYSREWYFNFALHKYQSNNLNFSTNKQNGLQNSGLIKLDGKREDGWNTAACQFTANTSIGNKLLLLVSGNKIPNDSTVYIDDIVVTKIYDGEYAAQIIKNNGEKKQVVYGQEGSDIPLETPHKLHYDFTGWYTDKACTTKFNATTFGSTTTPLNTANGSPLTIYAGWQDATNYIEIDPSITNGTLSVNCDAETVTVIPDEGYQLAPGSLKFSFNYLDKDYEKPVVGSVQDNDNSYSFTGILKDGINVKNITLSAKFQVKQDVCGATVASSYRVANATQTDGIRFLNRFYASAENLSKATFGAIVTPYDNIEATGVSNVTLENIETVKGKNIVADKFSNTNNTYRDYMVVITNVKDESREFAVIPYITIDGNTVYGTMEVRSCSSAKQYNKIGNEIFDLSVSGDAKSIVNGKGLREEFCDDFNGTSLDNEKFTVDFNTANVSESNIVVKDGIANLLITGTTRDNYQTSSITSHNRYLFTNDSYVEMRAKLPMQKASSNTFWAKSVKKDGILIEYDMFETFGTADKITSNIHIWDENTGDHYSLDSQTKGKYIESSNRQYTINDNEYHTFGIRRTNDAIKFYCDGNCYFTYDLTKLTEKYGVPQKYAQYFQNDAYIIIGQGVLASATNDQFIAVNNTSYDVDYAKGYYYFGNKYAVK